MSLRPSSEIPIRRKLLTCKYGSPRTAKRTPAQVNSQSPGVFPSWCQLFYVLSSWRPNSHKGYNAIFRTHTDPLFGFDYPIKYWPMTCNLTWGHELQENRTRKVLKANPIDKQRNTIFSSRRQIDSTNFVSTGA